MNQTKRKNETIRMPSKVNNVVDEYLNLVEERLPNLVESFNIFGSVSLGAYQDGMSDIDFYSVVKRKLNDEDIETLKLIHQDMKRKHPKPDLDGMYVTREDLDGRNEGAQTCLYFNEGDLRAYRSFDRNWIDAFQLQKYGIVMKGLPIKSYNLSTDWEQLSTNLVDNLNTYWVNWIKGCERVSSLQFIGLLIKPDMIEWGVLGVSRIYFSIKEKDITSKMGAGEYALQTVPEKYHTIIQESIRIRKGERGSDYTSVFKRRKDALEYMKFVINECNRRNV